MPSSTSSSDSVFTRSVPRLRWTMALVLALVTTVLVIGAWELKVRAEGYGPSINDTGDRWCMVREKVGEASGQTVIVGSSRAQFDFNLDTYAQLMKTERPLQLSMPGANPLGLLEHVAEQDGFDGTLILGVSPGLWFVPEGFPVDRANGATGRYDNWSPSQRVGTILASQLQKRLAFINAEDLTLPTLLSRIDVPNRAGAEANLPPHFPAYFAWIDEHRQATMWHKCDFGTDRAKLIQQTWIGLFTPPPPPPHLSAEEFAGMMKANTEHHLERITVAVEKVRARGAKVIFVRPPSTGTVRELELKFSPREQTWDLMLQASGAPGIHFEDHPQLASFDCPEWSHLTASDAVLYTERLVPLIQEALKSSE